MNFAQSTLHLYGVEVQMGKPRRKCTAYGVVSEMAGPRKRSTDFAPWQTDALNADGSRRMQDQELYDHTVELMRKAEKLMPEVWDEMDHIGRRMHRNIYSSLVDTMVQQSHDAKRSIARRQMEARDEGGQAQGPSQTVKCHKCLGQTGPDSPCWGQKAATSFNWKSVQKGSGSSHVLPDTPPRLFGQSAHVEEAKKVMIGVI